MARIPLPDGDGDERERLWRLRPELGAAAAQLAAAVYASTLPLRTFEAVRMRIAQVNNCPT
ncbi:MAG TPA: hypothetical protein VGQ42_12890 [Candidatus Dormibacteraeota bacterium]|jgi:hypothetical protein|nr:hypothetical protein [Candidatus Dormibacteraeota bacterium]